LKTNASPFRNKRLSICIEKQQSERINERSFINKRGGICLQTSARLFAGKPTKMSKILAQNKKNNVRIAQKSFFCIFAMI
jgi:hypothetical protein